MSRLLTQMSLAVSVEELQLLRHRLDVLRVMLPANISTLRSTTFVSDFRGHVQMLENGY